MRDIEEVDWDDKMDDPVYWEEYLGLLVDNGMEQLNSKEMYKQDSNTIRGLNMPLNSHKNYVKRIEEVAWDDKMDDPGYWEEYLGLLVDNEMEQLNSEEMYGQDSNTES